MNTILFVAILLVLAAPVVEIAVRRPGILLELVWNQDLRAFAQPPAASERSPTAAVANDCGAPRPDKERLAA